MPRKVKRGGNKRRAHYSYRINKTKKHRARSKKQKKIPCKQVEEAWDGSKTVKQNMEEMGLVYDLNKALKIASPNPQQTEEDEIGVLSEFRDVQAMEMASSTGKEKSIGKKKRPSQKKRKKTKVVEALEQEASQERMSEKRLPYNEVLACVRMIERYGDDHEAMAKDSHNYYQETASKIKHKINHFKQSHQYRAYLTAKSAKVEITENT